MLGKNILCRVKWDKMTEMERATRILNLRLFSAAKVLSRLSCVDEATLLVFQTNFLLSIGLLELELLEDHDHHLQTSFGLV